MIDVMRFKESDHTQKALIATWLIEIILNQLNNTTDSSQLLTLKKSLTDLMHEKKDNLDTVYLIFYSGNDLPAFATLRKNK